MILLASTTDKIQVVTSAAGQIDCLAPYIDAASATATPSGGGTAATRISTAATTDLVAAPAASTLRNVKGLNIRNSSASTANTVTVQWYNGTTTVELNKVSLAVGETLSFVEGIGWAVIAADGGYKAASARMLHKTLLADATGTLATTAQPWFPTASGVTLAASTTYYFEGLLYLTHGATTHTTALSFTGTAGLSNIMYQYWLSAATEGAIATASSEGVVVVATATVLNATAAVTSTRIELMGTIRTSTAGTLIPNFIYSASPTGTTLIKRSTFFRLWPIGDATTESVGTWV